MSVLGFGGAFVLAIMSVAFNFIVSIRPLTIFLTELFNFLYQNTINLFKKDEGFVKFSLKNEEYEKMYLYVISGILIFVGSFLIFFFGFGDLSVLGYVGCLLILVHNLAVTILSFAGIGNSQLSRKIMNILLTITAFFTSCLFFNKIASETAILFPKSLEWIIAIPSIGYAIFQAFLFSGQLNYAYPALILIPLCIPMKIEKQKKIKEESKEKKEEKPRRGSAFLDDVEREADAAKKSAFSSFIKFAERGTKGIFVLLIILLLVYNFQGIGVMNSYSDYTSSKYQPNFPLMTDFEIGTALDSISYSVTNISKDYHELFQEEFQKELIYLKELQVSTVKIDVRQELLDSSLDEFKEVIDELKVNGFKVLLTTYGYSLNRWTYQNVSFSEFTETLENQSVALIQECNPDFLLIYPQPFGYSSSFITDLQTVETWVSVINDTSNYLHSLTNDTKIGIKLSFNDFNPQNNIFAPLWENSTLDFVGFDYFIIHGRELDEINFYLDQQTNSTKEFWITEFGLSPVMYGERIQAGALERILEICVNDERVQGFVYVSLQDSTGGINTYGLVAQTGYKRLAFYKLKEIIEKVH
ncbi:MAG: hypothetical protein HGN29_11090 [Asgard group archaeon]|nr:hypothetical protein [Asgard group archaeon]